MIRIAVVEDDRKNAETLLNHLEQFSTETSRMITTQWFQNGREFIEAFHRRWDLVLLDNEMPEMSGMETARALRSMDKEVEIVFITNLAEYAMESYQVSAADYILKPVNYHELYLKLKKLLMKLDARKEESLVITVRGKWQRVPLTKLLYIEARGHTLIYHTENGETETVDGRSLSELEHELQEKGFYRVYKSYLVNLAFVADVEAECVLLGGTTLPVSRGKKQELRKRLLEYFSGKTG